MRFDEGNVQVIDVEAIMENCPITIPLRYIFTSSDCGVCNSHYILLYMLYYICDTRSKR